MKIRTNFVTNSSSASFVIAINKIPLNKVHEFSDFALELHTRIWNSENTGYCVTNFEKIVDYCGATYDKFDELEEKGIISRRIVG